MTKKLEEARRHIASINDDFAPWLYIRRAIDCILAHIEEREADKGPSPPKLDAAKQATAPDAKADGTQREQYEKQPDGESPQPPLNSGATVNEGTGINPTSQPAPGVVGSSEPSGEELSKLYWSAAQDGGDFANVAKAKRALYQAGLRAASSPSAEVASLLKGFRSELMSRSAPGATPDPSPAELSRASMLARIEAVLRGASERKPSPPESDEAIPSELRDATKNPRAVVLEMLARVKAGGDVQPALEDAFNGGYRVGRDIGRAERDSALRELSDARQADGETIGRLRGELAEAKARLAACRSALLELRRSTKPCLPPNDCPVCDGSGWSNDAGYTGQASMRMPCRACNRDWWRRQERAGATYASVEQEDWPVERMSIQSRAKP